MCTCIVLYIVSKNLQFFFHLTKDFPLKLYVEANSLRSFPIDKHTKIIPQGHDFFTNKKYMSIVSESSLQNENSSEVTTYM